jgi:hypothetical protein
MNSFAGSGISDILGRPGAIRFKRVDSEVLSSDGLIDDAAGKILLRRLAAFGLVVFLGLHDEPLGSGERVLRLVFDRGTAAEEKN